MGYYTRYKLTWDANGLANDLINQDMLIEQYLTDNSDKFYGIDSDGNSKDVVKWYDHVIDMIELSKRFPSVLFSLSGEGEDNEDVWVKHFKNGKMQMCKAVMTIPPFDESKLK